MMYFEEYWKKLTKVLSEKQFIHNWTKDKGYLGKGDFYALLKGKNVVCSIPGAKMPQKVPMRDFQITFNSWNKYIQGKISRAELRDQSRFTKYTISIIHQFEYLRE